MENVFTLLQVWLEQFLNVIGIHLSCGGEGTAAHLCVKFLYRQKILMGIMIPVHGITEVSASHAMFHIIALRKIRIVICCDHIFVHDFSFPPAPVFKLHI